MPLIELPRALERLGHSVIQSAGGDAGSEDSAPAEVPRLEPPMADDVAAGIASSESVAGVLTGTIRRDWGVAASGATGRVTIRPDPARLGTRAALSRVRAGGTAIDLRFRRRGDVASLSLRRGAGPAIGVDCAIRGTVPGELLLDGEPLGGEWASFDLAGSHDLQARLAYGPQLSSSSS